MRYDIRPATPDDAPQIRSLLQRLDMLAEGVDYSEFTPPVLVAVLDTMVIGVCSALLGRPMAYLVELAVSPAHQQQGVATSLVYSMETVLRLMGCRAWCAHVQEDRALNTYLKDWPGACEVSMGKGWVRVL